MSYNLREISRKKTFFEKNDLYCLFQVPLDADYKKVIFFSCKYYVSLDRESTKAIILVYNEKQHSHWDVEQTSCGSQQKGDFCLLLCSDDL